MIAVWLEHIQSQSQGKWDFPNRLWGTKLLVLSFLAGKVFQLWEICFNGSVEQTTIAMAYNCCIFLPGKFQVQTSGNNAYFIWGTDAPFAVLVRWQFLIDRVLGLNSLFMCQSFFESRNVWEKWKTSKGFWLMSLQNKKITKNLSTKPVFQIKMNKNSLQSGVVP